MNNWTQQILQNFTQPILFLAGLVYIFKTFMEWILKRKENSHSVFVTEKIKAFTLFVTSFNDAEEKLNTLYYTLLHDRGIDEQAVVMNDYKKANRMFYNSAVALTLFVNDSLLKKCKDAYVIHSRVSEYLKDEIVKTNRTDLLPTFQQLMLDESQKAHNAVHAIAQDFKKHF